MIYPPPPQSILNKDIRISGDVEIHPTASLASGVILQAAPDSRIVIGADVCIGMGVIINACHGLIEIASGAILGSGVLIIGSSKIGHNSCIGTSTTIYQEDITSMAVIEPGSIVGDLSRQASEQNQPNSKQASPPPTKLDQQTERNSPTKSDTTPYYAEQYPLGSRYPEVHPLGQAQGNASPDNRFTGTYYFKEKAQQAPTQNYSHNNKTTSISQVETSAESAIQKPKVPVVGQVYINELLVTLFPYRKNSDSNS